MKQLSIVIPVYQEEETVVDCYRRLITAMAALPDYDYELLFVNDGSKDQTAHILRDLASADPRLQLISLSRNFGHQIAITAGIDHSEGDAIVIIDADLQDPPELIPDMVRLWEQGYKVVYGQRRARRGESSFKKATAAIFYRLLNGLTDISIPPDTGDFRLIDKCIRDHMRRMRERNRYVRGLVSWVGFSQIGLPYTREERVAGKTKYPLRKMVKFAIDGITSFSTVPLKMAFRLGFLSIFLSLALVGYVLVSKFFYPEVTIPGWSSILIAVVFFGGVQLFTLGIIGEYIGRIYDETKNRPLYVVENDLAAERVTNNHYQTEIKKNSMPIDIRVSVSKGSRS